MKAQRQIKILFLIFLFFSPTILSAQTPRQKIELTFSQAIRLAQTRSLQSILSEQRVWEAVALSRQALSTLLPQLNASLSQIRQTKNLASAGIPVSTASPLVGPFDTSDARLKLTQTIFDPEVWARLEAAKAGETLSHAQDIQTKQDAMALGATLYIQTKRYTQAVQLMRNLLNRDKKQYVIVDAKFHNGTASALELKQAKAFLETSRYRWRQAQQQAQESILSLKLALGIDREAQIIFKDDIQFDNLLIEEAGKKNSINDLPDVKTAQAAVNQAQLQKNAVRAEYFPKISALGDYGLNGSSLPNAEKTYSFGGQVSLPIMEGGNRSARIAQAQSQMVQAQAELNNVSQDVQNKIINAQKEIIESVAFYQAQNASWLAAQQQWHLAQNRFKNGTGSSLEIFEAQADLALSLAQKQEAYATYQMAQVNLARRLGKVEQLILK